jgi:hypothetical protein
MSVTVVVPCDVQCYETIHLCLYISQFSFCTCVLTSIFEATIAPLQRIQKAAARDILNLVQEIR